MITVRCFRGRWYLHQNGRRGVHSWATEGEARAFLRWAGQLAYEQA